MTDAAVIRRVLILVVGEQEPSALPPPIEEAEIFVLTEKNSREALGKIFAADSVAVWGTLLQPDPQ